MKPSALRRSARRAANAGTIASSNGSRRSAEAAQERAPRQGSFRDDHDLSPHLKRRALRRCRERTARSDSRRAPRRARCAHRRHVVGLDAAAERVGQELLGQRCDERSDDEQHRAEPSRPLNAVPSAVRRRRRSARRLVDRAPAADRVEVLEREAERIHQRVARRARRVRAVLLRAARASTASSP